MAAASPKTGRSMKSRKLVELVLKRFVGQQVPLMMSGWRSCSSGFLPESIQMPLEPAEESRWQQHLRDRIIGPGMTGLPRVQESLDRIEALRTQGADTRVLNEVEAWTRRLASAAGVEAANR